MLPAGFSSSYMDEGLHHCNELVFPSISEERERERKREEERERGGGERERERGGGEREREG